MTNHYCTYFDRGYLAQGLAMARSLERYDADAVVWVLALDGEVAEVLRAIGGPRLRILRLEELLARDDELRAAQRDRPTKEFIFTLTPCLLRHLLQTEPDMERAVYLDADLFFFGNPDVIWKEWADGSVFVVPHRYPVWHDDSARYGVFNVGIVGFRRDDSGLQCLDWWRARCLESCALTGDGVHYGDQKYLDEWPSRFPGVIASSNRGLNLAPWNWAACKVTIRATREITITGAPLVVFHFAQFRRIDESWWDSGQLEYGVMPRPLRARIYEPYAAALDSATGEVRRVYPEFSPRRSGWRGALGPWHLALLRLCWGQFWCRCNGRWISMGCGLGRFSGRMMGIYRRWQRRGK